MSSTLGFDHPCLACAYNLRGLAIGASCPECSAPVADSLKRRLLRHADPRFVRRLRNGARMISISAILPLSGLFLIVITGLLVGSRNTTLGTVVGVGGAITLIVLTWAFFVFGWIRLTAIEFDTPSDSRPNVIRARCRWLSVALAIAIPASFFVSFGMFTLPLIARGPGSFLFSSAWGIVPNLIVSAILIAQFWYAAAHIRTLSGRIPTTGLPKYAAAVFWVCVAAAIVGVLQQIAGVVLMRTMMQMTTQSAGSTQTSQMPPPSAAGSIAMIASAILGFIALLLNLAIYAMYIGLFCRLWAHLSKAVKQSAALQS